MKHKYKKEIKFFIQLLLILAIILLTNKALAQEPERTETFFSYPTAYSLGSKNSMRIQHNIFIDPFGKPPNGGNGRQKGYEINLIMSGALGGIYVGASISKFDQLENGYTDVFLHAGITFHMFHTTGIRYYIGGRGGKEWRPREENSSGYTVAGLTTGMDITIWTMNNGNSLYLGLESNSDYRVAQQDRNYGDSDVSKKSFIFTNSAVTINNRIRIGFSF